MSRGECATMRSMKRGAGVCTCVEPYWTQGGMDGEKRRGEVCVCGRHTCLERYIDQCGCAGKKEPGAYTHRG